MLETAERIREGAAMSEPDLELAELRARAATGDRDAMGELVESAGERGDFAELRRLAEAEAATQSMCSSNWPVNERISRS